MQCDVCNATVLPGSGERITPEVFTYLIDNGFGLDDTNIKMLTDAGMSRAAAEEALKERYRCSRSDWFLCSECASKAMAIVAVANEKWVAPNYIAVTRVAEEVGLGFDVIGVPVALGRAVWEECVEWTDDDSIRQTYQEQDARLWDVLFTGGGSLQLTINQFLKQRIHHFSILCIRRDGRSAEAITINLLIRPVEICGQQWLAIEKG